MANSTINEINTPRPDIHQGLSLEQVAELRENGFANKTSKSIEKSFLRILFDNTFTPFNVALFVIAAIYLAFIIYLAASGNGETVSKDFGISKFGFLIPAVINALIGSVQEIHGKRVLSKLKLLNQARAITVREGERATVLAEDIVLHDVLQLSAGEQCLADCKLEEGFLQVDESMLTGESDPVEKHPGDMVLAGSIVVVGEGLAYVERVGDDLFASEMSSQVRALPRHRSELMDSINKIIRKLAHAIGIVVAVILITLCVKIHLYGNEPGVFAGDELLSLSSPTTWGKIVLTAGAFAVGMIPEGLVLLASVALAVSIIKLAREKTLVQELYSLENLSRVDTICLDKTGTLTDGTMEVVESLFYGNEQECVRLLRMILGAFDTANPTSAALADKYGKESFSGILERYPFSSEKKRSGVRIEEGEILLGAPEYLLSDNHPALMDSRKRAAEGKRVLALTKDGVCLGLFVLNDHIRAAAKETIHFFYENNVQVKIISGDNMLTVSKIAEICGVKDTNKAVSLEGVPLEDIPTLVDDNVIFARVSPEQKLALVEALQNKGRKVAMTGDGVNDILALRRADASITFSKATDAAKACSDVVLLDNDFCHLQEVVAQGRRVVNNIERSAILFLMKTTAIIGLAFCLIPFKRGQLWYSGENIYLMQTSVIAVGGFLLSLEPQKEPIRGSFLSNVVRKAILSGALVLLAAILPLILSRAPLLFGQDPIISDDNAKSLISIMTTLAGLVCAITMCIPFSKYRVFCMSAVVVATLFLAFALPTSFVGGQVTSFSMFRADDGNFFHAPIFQVAFQPWNSEVLVSIHGDVRNYIVMAAFMAVAFPVYGYLYWRFFIRAKAKSTKK